MKAIQIVIDEPLLRRVDRSAKKQQASRSAAIRRLLALGLEKDALSTLASAEARAYARIPESPEESPAFRALARAQQRAMDDLARTDGW